MARASQEFRKIELEQLAQDGAAGLAQALAIGCEPVILPGLCRDWPAVRAARDGWAALSAYLVSFASERLGEAFVGAPAIEGRYDYGDGPDGFNFERQSLTLAQGLERIGEASADRRLASVYMGSLPIEDYLPGFGADNRTDLLAPGVQPRAWLGNASRVACHYDTYENLACVVAGRRRFTLYPPDAVGALYVGPIDHTLAGQPIALAVGAPAGDPRYPRFAAAADRARIVELEPGDALFLPKLWWHQVEALEPANMLVNYWWDGTAMGPDAPYLTMMLAMTAIADRPPEERAAWRAFFDHYVFRPDGHPLAHLPADRHGLLDKSAYGRVRALVMRALRGG
ncbi:MAG: cupin-like domain-containing protein [Caulobacter sp.]|nr:cupin-like domain-containing protein [Caulobacter sp.]